MCNNKIYALFVFLKPEAKCGRRGIAILSCPSEVNAVVSRSKKVQNRPNMLVCYC